MGQHKNKLIAILFILLIFVGISSKNTYAEEEKKVLFITGYNSHTADFDNRISGIKKGLGENIDLHIKYLSYKITENAGDRDYYYNDMKTTIEEENYDAIIIGDYFTLQFALEYRNDIFNSIPIVFFGVFSDSIINDALKYENITGIKQSMSLKSTIDLILDFHTFVDNIVLINNYEDVSEIDDFKQKIIPKYKNISFETIFTSEMTEEELEGKLKEYDKNDAIITMYANDFADSHWISDKNINRLISNSTNHVPVYNLTEGGIGFGSIGGKVLSISNQGKKAGEIARDVIEGKVVKPLDSNKDKINKYIFDYNQMYKFGIKMKELPKGSQVINSPRDMIVMYKGVFIFLSLFIVSLILVIILLIRYLRYKRKHEDALLRAMTEADEISKLKNYFIVNMNHELKTPITVINSVMQLTRYKRKYNENYLITKKNITLVEENCQRLLRLVNNIIDLEKIDSNSVDLFLENMNIVELIEDTVLSVVPFAQAKNVDITFDTTEEEIIMAVDRSKIERIILNLLSNAIKYSKEAGFVDIKLDTDFKKLILTVEDDGIGMKEEDLKKVFDRFVQIDSSLTRKVEGSGIGLSIVKSFVECHNGDIKVESVLHKGSKFIIEIPIEVIEEEKIENNLEIIDIEVNLKQELSDIYI